MGAGGVGQAEVWIGIGEDNIRRKYLLLTIPQDFFLIPLVYLFLLDIKWFLLALIFNLCEIIVCKIRPFIFTASPRKFINCLSKETERLVSPSNRPQWWALLPTDDLVLWRENWAWLQEILTEVKISKRLWANHLRCVDLWSQVSAIVEMLLLLTNFCVGRSFRLFFH